MNYSNFHSHVKISATPRLSAKEQFEEMCKADELVSEITLVLTMLCSIL